MDSEEVALHELRALCGIYWIALFLHCFILWIRLRAMKNTEKDYGEEHAKMFLNGSTILKGRFPLKLKKSKRFKITEERVCFQRGSQFLY